MMLKSKKKLIVILSIVVVIAIVLIASSALFSLKTVSIEYGSVLSHNSVMSGYSKDEIVKVGNFAYNKNILFIGFDGAKERIEKAFPYAKVQRFVRNFPNNVVVYLSERMPVFAVKNLEDKYVVMDSDLKVLEVSSVLTGACEGVPLLTAPSIDVNTLRAGDFCQNSVLKSVAFNIQRGITDDDVASKINITNVSQISYDVGASEDAYVLHLTLNSGTKIEIKGINNLAEKVLGAFYTYNEYVCNNSTSYPDLTKVKVKVDSDFTLAGGKQVPVEYPAE